MRRLGEPRMSSRASLQKVITLAGVLSILIGTPLFFVGVTFASGPSDGSQVPNSALPIGSYTAHSAFSSGQVIEVKIPTNTVLSPGAGIAIVECSDPGGSPSNDPTGIGDCDGNTHQGDTVTVDSDGSIDYTNYTVYALPDSISLDEPPTQTPVCNLSNECVLYIGQNQNDFTQPHFFSQPFWVAPNSDDLGENPGDGTSPTVGTTTTTTSSSTTSPTTTSSTTTTSPTTTTTTSPTSTTTTSPTSTTTTSPTSTTTTTMPTSTTTTFPAPSGPIGSFVSSASVQLGPSGTVTDSVVVVGIATDGSPTGTVNFYVCQVAGTQTPTTGPCASLASNHLSNSRLSPAPNDTSDATSATFTPASAGTWCFSAVYGGDNHYASASDNTSASNLDQNECVLVTTATSSPASYVSSSNVTLGASGTVNDQVTVTGDAPEAPTGSVEFFACRTGSTQSFSPGPCATTGTPEDTEALVTGAGSTSSATSVDFTPTAAGTWCFSVLYGGDANYSASSDNTSSSNLDPNECVLVATDGSTTASTVSSPVITLGPSGTASDTVTVTGNSFGGAPSGSVEFFVCQTGSSQTLTTGPCASAGTPEDTESLVASGGDTSRATSVPFTPTSTGTWCFSASYGGDSNYSGSTDNTSASNLDPNECLLVNPAPYTITSANSASATVGSSFSFEVTTNGTPLPKIKKKGKLPTGLKFVAGSNGTASVTGTPKKSGTYSLTITATFGTGKSKHVATQAFTLTVSG